MRDLAILSIAAIVLCFRVWQIDQPDILFDDAFISFRYAQNLASGMGLVYNPNEHVEGYTNFLWTVIFAGVFFLKINPILASKVLLLIFTLIILIFIHKFCKRSICPESSLFSGVALITYALMGSQARYVVSGMETLFFTLLLIASIYLFLYKPNSIVAGVAFAFTAMTRPEGVMFFLIAFLYMILRIFDGQSIVKPTSSGNVIFGGEHPTPREAVAFASGFILPYGIYFAWRFNFYGHFLPNTFYAKVGGSLAGNLQSGTEALISLMHNWGLFPLFIFPWLSLPKVKRNNLLFLISITIATVVYFLVIGGDFIVWFGPRLLMPVLPMMVLLSVKGLQELYLWLKHLKTPWLHGMAIASLSMLLLYEYHFSWPGFNNMTNFTTQMRGWTEVGLWIAEHTPKSASIATDAAGLIPYYSNRYAIDMFGLTDEHIAHLKINHQGFGVVGHEKVDPWYILRRRPTCIVSTWLSPAGEAIAAGLKSVIPQFNQEYALIAVAKVRMGAPSDGMWIIETQTYHPQLYENGYWTGIFCLKDDFLQP